MELILRLFPSTLFWLLLAGLGWGLAFPARAATPVDGTTATVTTSEPVAFAKGAGRLRRPVSPEEVFRVITVTDREVTLADANGFVATLDRAQVVVHEPAPAPTNAVPTPPEKASPPVVPGTAATIPSPDAAIIRQINDAFQLPLLGDGSLWNDVTEAAAKRLGWPRESQTDVDESYRLYALPKGTPVLGTLAYSLALYGRHQHPTYVSLVFANRGDLQELSTVKITAAVKDSARTIDDRLTAVLGPFEAHVYGPTADSRETVHRWDWKGHTFLLSSPRGTYTAIKIVPTAVADHYGDVANMDREAIKAELATRVQKSDNGDVVLQQIPMVDQGPKGYCVPATWERYLRYVDVPADMYVLAMLGNTGDNGTSPAVIREGLSSYVGSYGRRIETTDVPLDIPHLSRFLDRGLPLMWSCVLIDKMEREINVRMRVRSGTNGWDDYLQKLRHDDQGMAIDKSFYQLDGHMRMIIGYNATTNEVAISDSWGPRFAIRWLSVPEAQAISLNDLEYIQW